MKQTLLIKHAVSGRLFFDSRRSDIAFTVEPSGDGWLFEIETVWNETVEELLRRKNELNVFIFKEDVDQPLLKTWYYVKDGPVEYDKESELLTIRACSRIEYYPHEYSQ